MSIYQSLFDIIHNYIYGGVALTSDMNLVCTLLSTMGAVFCIAVPFLIVWRFVTMVMGMR